MALESIVTAAGTVAVNDVGDGDMALIMLHGNSGSKEVFDAQVARFSPRMRVIAIDLLGHGQSSDANEPGVNYTLVGHGAYLTDLISDLDLDRIVLVGASLGGHLALQIAPDIKNLAGLVLVGSPPFEQSGDGLSRAFRPGLAGELSGKEHLSAQDVEDFIGVHQLGRDLNPAKFRQAILRSDGKARAVFVGSIIDPASRDQRAVAEGLSLPVVMVNGSNDDAVNLDYIDTVRVQDPVLGKPIRVVSAGHAPHMSQPDRFNAIMSDFFRAIERTGIS